MSAVSNDHVKVAVIGAGAAGVGAVWQLRRLLGSDAHLTVYERENVVGGRAKTVEFAGATVEIGGSILHSTGKYAVELMKLTGSKEGESGLAIDGKDETYAFWTDQGFAIQTGTSLVSMAWSILRYTGIRSALGVARSAKKTAGLWERVYDLQSGGVIFDSPAEQLRAMNLTEATTTSLRDALRGHGVNDTTISDIVEPIIHNMYNQGAEISAFGGEVGLAGAGLAGGYLYCIEGGNWTLFDRALRTLGADLRLDTPVTELRGSQDGWRVTDDSGNTEQFDAVVLAAPLALADVGIWWDGDEQRFPVHPYREVHTTLVVGELSPEYFGAPAGQKLPSTVFVADSASTTIKSVGVTGFSPIHDQRIYKIFSAENYIDDAHLERIFTRIDEVYRFVWRGAYPVLTPGIEHLPYRLLPGLFYANAFETVAGSIEVELVAGYNVGHLVARGLSGR